MAAEPETRWWIKTGVDPKTGEMVMFWVGQRIHEAWTGLYRIEAVDGVPEVVEVRVVWGDSEVVRLVLTESGQSTAPMPDGWPPVTTKAIRELAPDRARRKALPVFDKLAHGKVSPEVLERAGYQPATILRTRPVIRPGRRGHSDRFYAGIVAEVELEAAEGRGANKRVAAKLTARWGQRVKPQTIADWLMEAARRGIATKGRRRALTRYGRQLLEEGTDDE
jgi:hypothetical protein